MKKKLIVPIVFDLLDYHVERPALSWVFEMYTNYCINNNMPIIAQEDYFNQEIFVLDKYYKKHRENQEKKDDLNEKKKTFKKYSITNEETLSITNSKKATFEDQVHFMSHTNKIYEGIINKKLDLIEKDYKQKVDAIFTWYWNPTLEKIGKDRDIEIITQEISPIREFNGNYRTRLSYFVFGNKFDNDYTEELYKELKKDKEFSSLKIFSREELLAIFLNTEDLNLIKELQKPSKYDLGLSPPFENDYFFEIYKNEAMEKTFKKIDKLFAPKDVTMRYRVASTRDIGNSKWDRDDSEKAIYWILQCKRILTYVSNIAFDAILFGKTVYLLSDNMPFSFKSITQLKYKDESVVDTEYLNFMIFGYFVPWDLMLDQEYIEWRLSHPSIIEIYKRNQNYIFKELGLSKEHDITLEKILRETHPLDGKDIDDIVSYSEYTYLESLRDKLNTQDKDIEELKEEKEEIKRQNMVLEEEKEELTPDALEFREFKETKIWKGLTMYRKLKKYTKNFFINIYRDGPVSTFKRIFERIKNVIKYRRQREIDNNRYKYWVKNNKITIKKRWENKKELKSLEYQPLISIVMPVYNVEVKWIAEAVKSIQNQIYKNWELCIADDASTNRELKKYLKRISKHSKIKVTFREKNGHISEASNSALKLAKGEFIALMDNDDIIYPHALAEVVKLLNEKPKTDFIYSDEDKLDMKGKRVEPFFKPDWSPDLFMSTNYLCHFTLMRKKLIDDVGGFRKGYEGSQDYDLFLRVTEKTKNIEHIPDILYSWRKIPGSTASEYSDKDYAEKNSIKALEEALKRRELKGKVTKGLFLGSFRVKYDIKGEPLVSILIPTKDKYEYIERCISSLLEKTTYSNYEVIIIDTGSTEKETLDYYKTLEDNPRIRFLYWDKKFNYSAVNNYGAKHSKGEYILLLNNDTEIITPNWIEGMLEHAQRKDIGAVGAKLYYPNDTIQHAGVLLGINGGTGRGVAGHAFKYFPRKIQGFPVQKDIIRNYSAVTAACLMVEKKKFDEVGGLEETFRIAFNDVDFCLKLLKKGYYNLYTPYPELYHHESVSVGKPEEKTRDIKEFGNEINMMYTRWEILLLNDPFYNMNLTLRREDFTIRIE